jgi:hypothetical protein
MFCQVNNLDRMSIVTTDLRCIDVADEMELSRTRTVALSCEQIL